MIVDPHAPIFVISVAAELAEMHPQTLRQYDRLGIVKPNRAPGRSRRYSQHDVDMLREVQRLSHEGVSLEGIRRIMQLENQVEALRAKVRELGEQLESVTAEMESRPPRPNSRVFAAGLAGDDIVALARGQRPRARSQAVVIWRPQR
ncbi:MerR family transcriptional regulator/heat shock protein HspR [Arthrobacter silviterrae]|uniref:MerR family transcriptional regulator n=1 Tax=Arthrobacter silviterrae TaxID=2026658 RepID=A0ABX0DDU2_9MICC|nr:MULTISPECIES: MerR family transcriptional regulator [Arthrobacter]MCU6479593.1 MerR family transcriptional regulator [Arthrobacter sp. A2-55]MDQ0278006.1 MerR family transcriptional regulator/heat shock protein HspR [Arthrobacter silviterrae]NGN83560.1 MerR family transcriptional regulator [Arthrobacter silviterrae]